MKIIVLTPVKNEGWILGNFLKATSLFADHIIIADQNSTDNSLAIARKFSKVHIIANNKHSYSEADRQQLLLNTARDLYPGRKIIFTLDADEIISGDSLNKNFWNELKNFKPNTVFYFEKPEIYLSIDTCIRYTDNYFPLAFVDNDLFKHEPEPIHSLRFPINDISEKISVEDIKFLHLAYLRPLIQRSKYRFYSVQENLLQSAPWYRRRRRYRSPNHLLPKNKISSSLDTWFKYPQFGSLNFDKITDMADCWYDAEVVNAIKEKGSVRFWLDDIWDKDWNNYLDKTSKSKTKKIIPPPLTLMKFLQFSDRFNK